MKTRICRNHKHLNSIQVDSSIIKGEIGQKAHSEKKSHRKDYKSRCVCKTRVAIQQQGPEKVKKSLPKCQFLFTGAEKNQITFCKSKETVKSQSNLEQKEQS